MAGRSGRNQTNGSLGAGGPTHRLRTGPGTCSRAVALSLPSERPLGRFTPSAGTCPHLSTAHRTLRCPRPAPAHWPSSCSPFSSLFINHSQALTRASRAPKHAPCSHSRPEPGPLLGQASPTTKSRQRPAPPPRAPTPSWCPFLTALSLPDTIS